MKENEKLNEEELDVDQEVDESDMAEGMDEGELNPISRFKKVPNVQLFFG